MDAKNFLLMNSKYFPEDAIPFLRERLENMTEDQLFTLSTVQYKDPMMMLLCSFFGGTLGIDRFLIGDTGLGIGKLLTGGGCGIWAIVDLFLIQEATRRKNLEKLETFLSSM